MENGSPDGFTAEMHAELPDVALFILVIFFTCLFEFLDMPSCSTIVVSVLVREDRSCCQPREVPWDCMLLCRQKALGLSVDVYAAAFPLQFFPNRVCKGDASGGWRFCFETRCQAESRMGQDFVRAATRFGQGF